MKKPLAISVLNNGATRTTPPVDWRMPATVTTSSGISGSLSALAAAQATASSKSRPSFAVAISGTEWVEYQVSEAGTVILSWLGQINSATATVTVNGVDQSFATRYPTGSSVAGTSIMQAAGGRRQFMRLNVVPGDTIRLTIAAGANARTISPLLHKIPSARPWEAYIIFGASRESDGLSSALIENAITTDDPTRDPIFFTHAVSGADLIDIVGYVNEAVAAYRGVAYFAFMGSVMGNTITAQRPYDAGEKAAIDANLASILTATAGFHRLWGSTSFRAYPSAPAVTPTDQSGGSLPYNDTVLFPFIAANLSYMYDDNLQRTRYDTYLALLRERANLNPDGIHDAYPEERAELVRTLFKYSRAMSWAGIRSKAEDLVVTAEANATVKARALIEYTEATYAMLALASTSAKTALQARLTAIYPTALFYEAVRLVDAAVLTNWSSDKTIAQTALNAASSAGYSGGTSPNTIAAQQARIDAIVTISYDQTINIGFGSSTAVSTWNRTNSINTTGVIIADLLNQ